MAAPMEWFCALLDTAPDVYFRYSLAPGARLAYVSPAVEALTGHRPDAFYEDPDLCFAVVAGADRRLLRRVLKARRDLTMTVRLVRDNVAIPVELRTVALVRRRRLVAIEGVVRLAVTSTARPLVSAATPQDGTEPVQQRLASLLVEVHDLLHRVLPPSAPGAPEPAVSPPDANVVCLGALEFNRERMTAREGGVPVSLTTRETLLLRYLLERPGRVVSRQQLLQDVWEYHFTGDDRTIDVHVSRLRRKLPSLRGRLVALRQIGYRLDLDEPAKAAL